MTTVATASATTPSAPDEPGRLPFHRRPTAAWLAALCSYVPLAAIGYLPVWDHWSAQLNGCNCWDQLLEEWFVQWFPSAIGHGHSVLVTNYLDAPGGINLMWNTSNAALSLLASPLTETVGVVHTFAILMVLSLAVSASTMFLLLRRWVAWWPAAWLGGLVYGFSTYLIEESALGRLHLAFGGIPPLVVLLIDKLARDERPKSMWIGIALGVLLAVQIFVSEEIFLIMCLLVAVGLVFIGVSRRTQAIARARQSVPAIVAAGLSFLVVAGYPLLVQVFGADTLTGPPQTHAQLALFSLDLTSPIVPGAAQMFNVPWTDQISATYSAASAGELTEYVGIPLLILVLVSVVAFRRRLLIQTFAVTGFVSFVLSLGPRLLVDNHRTGVPLPDALLVRLPFLGDIIPSRYAIGVWFSIAVIFATAAEELWRRLWRTLPSASERAGASAAVRRWLPAAIVIAVGLVCVLPLVPDWPSAQQSSDVPAFFTSRDVTSVPEGSLALTYPYALAPTAWPMLWQADTDMRFRMLGGYAIAPDASGIGTFAADSNALGDCLSAVYTHGDVPGSLCAPGRLRETVDRLGVTTVLASESEPNIADAKRVLVSTLRASPRAVGGVFVWECLKEKGDAGCTWT